MLLVNISIGITILLVFVFITILLYIIIIIIIIIIIVLWRGSGPVLRCLDPGSASYYCHCCFLYTCILLAAR